MLQIITAFILLLNPAIGFFTDSPRTPQIATTASKNEVFLSSLENYKLPLSENIFLASQLIPAYPIRDWNIPEPQITAKVALVFDAERQRILWQKDGLRDARPIASLTKLMTALVTVENARMNDIFTVSKKAVQTPGELGGLIVGEQLSVENLLYALLVESSNDAAVALSENVSTTTKKDFVGLMNQKARNLGLTDTAFADPSGLDPANQSSARDLNVLMQEFLKYSVLQKITQTAVFDFKSVDAKFDHHLTSTDKLLGQYPEIIAGKTGYTEEAGNCLILAWRSPRTQGTVISIVMDSQDRMAESAALLEWTKKAYLW